MNSFFLGLLGVMALGFICAFSFIDGKSLSFDEGISIWFSQLDWLDLWNAVHRFDGALTAYYALLHLWVGTFGTSTTAARSLSAVFAVVTIPGVYLTAGRLFDRRTALVAATLCGTSTFVVTYAQDVRPYALEICASTLSMLALLHFLLRPGKLSAAAFVLASVVCVYLHVFAVLLVAAQFASLPLLQLDWRRHFRLTAAMAAAIVLLCAPVAILQLHDGLAQFDWIAKPDITALVRPFFTFSGSAPQGILALICCSFLVVPSAHKSRRNVIAALALWVTLPIISLYAVSLFHPVFVSRYLAPSFPSFIILVAAGITSLRRTPASYAVTLAAVLLSVRVLWSDRYTSDDDFRGVARFIELHAGPGDAVVVFQPAAVYAFNAELASNHGALAAPITYPLVDSHTWPAQMDHPNPDTIPLGDYAHVWLVLPENDPVSDEKLRAHLNERYTPQAPQQFARITVERFDLR